VPPLAEVEPVAGAAAAEAVELQAGAEGRGAARFQGLAAKERETGVIMLSGGEKGSARGLPTRAKKPPSPNPLLLDLWGPCVSVSACHAPPSR
jgi:hypothetical protein